MLTPSQSLDATLATYAKKQCILTDTQVREPFFADQVRVPHLGDGYRGILEEILFSQRVNGELPSRTSIEEEVARIEACICACQRLVGSAKSGAFLAPSRQVPLQDSTIFAAADSPERIWDAIQLIHSAIQNLQQELSSLSILPTGCDVQAIDDFFIASLEMDSNLVDLVFLVHLELGECRRDCRRGREGELEGLLGESEARVRKCLKLMTCVPSSFVASVRADKLSQVLCQGLFPPLLAEELSLTRVPQLYSTSRDNSLIPAFLHHLELLPTWLTLALHRVGERGGPQTTEFEVADDEITWFVSSSLPPSLPPNPLAGSPKLSNSPLPTPQSPRPVSQNSLPTARSLPHLVRPSLPPPLAGNMLTRFAASLSSSNSSPTDLIFPVSPTTPFPFSYEAQVSTYDPPAGGSVFREEWVEPKWVGEEIETPW